MNDGREFFPRGIWPRNLHQAAAVRNLHHQVSHLNRIRMEANREWEDRSPRIDNYYHAMTEGNPSINLYETESDFVSGMNYIPPLLERFGVELLIGKLNDSHEHFVMRGTYLACWNFVREHVRHAAQTIAYRRREAGFKLLDTYFPDIDIKVLPIETENSLRNRTAYVAKNSYDSGLPIAPWYDPWSTASTIFAPTDLLRAEGTRIGDLGSPTVQKRLLRTQQLYPQDWRVDHRLRINPVWYTDFASVNRLYGAPEWFILRLVNRKNSEEEEAIRQAATVEKTVQDLRLLAANESRRLFGSSDIERLETFQKIQVCYALRSIGATYSQLQRITRIPTAELKRLMR